MKADEGEWARPKRGLGRPALPLKPWARELAKIEAVQPGLSNAEYGTLVGAARQHVQRIRKDRRYRQILATWNVRLAGERHARARQEAFDLAAEVAKRERAAWERKVALMEQDENLSVANQAVDWVLNRRLPETKPAEERTLHVKVSVEERARLGGVLAEAIEVEALPGPEEESDG